MARSNNICIYFQDIEIVMEKGIDIKDITLLIEEIIKKSGIKNGVVHITSIGSTGSVTTIEYEPGVIKDLKDIINEIVSPDRYYEHEKAWHDGNGHSHVQAAIIGPSISVSIRNYEMVLGTWQQIVIINHDIKQRTRKITVTVVGNT
ncbi:secondary thiamine-phosphate synthase enzyme YjbQ [Desulfothermus naphthae]